MATLAFAMVVTVAALGIARESAAQPVTPPILWNSSGQRPAGVPAPTSCRPLQLSEVVRVDAAHRVSSITPEQAADAAVQQILDGLYPPGGGAPTLTADRICIVLAGWGADPSACVTVDENGICHPNPCVSNTKFFVEGPWPAGDNLPGLG